MLAQIAIFPEQATQHAAEVDMLFLSLLGMSAFFSALIAGLMLYFSVRYRRRSEDERPPSTPSSTKLEIAWTVVPLIISLGLFGWGAQQFFNWANPPADALEIYAVGKQWMWKFQHLGGQREINQLHVPVNQAVKLTMTSQDVIHSFYVPAFRIHKDLVPGHYSAVWFKATKPGRYHLFCSEYCGTDHSKMIGEVIVLEKEAFRNWLAEGADGSLASAGRQLFQKLQCVSCHSGDARARAPTLENVFGTSVPLQGGSHVRADETYVRESILHPDARVVAGFQPIMPTYKGQVNEEEVFQLIQFIKSLRAGQTPPRTEDAEPPAVEVDRSKDAP